MAKGFFVTMLPNRRKNMENRQNEVQIKINEESFKGVYSNGAIISHTQNEFILDYLSIFQDKAVLASRVIVSPSHAKRLMKVLQDNIALYEQKFGEIKTDETNNAVKFHS